jgi:uncharacterized membrane protein
LYIYTTKRNSQKVLVCPIGGHCDSVVNSKYSKFLGVSVELMGALYYGLIIVFYGVYFFFPNIFTDTVLFFFTSFSVIAFLFSVYLVLIQAFVIKNWCTWCLFSAGFTTLIAVLAVFGASFDIVPLLVQYKGVIVFFHALAAAVGVGATTVTDVLFFKFLKDYNISDNEKSIMDTMSHIIWVALGVLIVTGVGLYLPRSLDLAESSKFLVKTVAVGIIVLNGFLLNFIVSPKLTRLVFKKDAPKEISRMRKLAFATGAISISSWYIVFILGSLRSIPLSFKTGLTVYFGIVLFAVLMSQVYQRKLVSKNSL